MPHARIVDDHNVFIYDIIILFVILSTRLDNFYIFCMKIKTARSVMP